MPRTKAAQAVASVAAARRLDCRRERRWVVRLWTQRASYNTNERHSSPHHGASTSTDCQKIQFILRQTVYFLRETRSAPNAMRPPPVDGIPRPFAALRGEEVGLGLYGLRVERETLKLLQQSVEGMREQSLKQGEDKSDGQEGGGSGGAVQTDETMKD